MDYHSRQYVLHFYVVHIPNTNDIELHCAASPCSNVCRWLVIDHCRMPHALDVVLCVRCVRSTIRGDLMKTLFATVAVRALPVKLASKAIVHTVPTLLQQRHVFTTTGRTRLAGTAIVYDAAPSSTSVRGCVDQPHFKRRIGWLLS